MALSRMTEFVLLAHELVRNLHLKSSPKACLKVDLRIEDRNLLFNEGLTVLG